MADELLDALDDGRPVVDLIAGFTQPLTITTICDVLGVPSEDKPLFHRWAAELVGAGHPPEVVEAASNNVIAYAQASIETKRADPGQDMLSVLVHGKDGGDRLTQDELVGMFFLIIDRRSRDLDAHADQRDPQPADPPGRTGQAAGGHVADAAARSTS